MTRFCIPTYVRRILKRSEFAVHTSQFTKEDDPSYTIVVPKHSIYAQADTLKGELDKLVAWAKRMLPSDFNWKDCPVVVVRSCPKETHYHRQYAHVDIFDPIMQRIEYLVGTGTVKI